MENNEQQNNEETKQIDPMLAAYLESPEYKSEQDTNQEALDAENKAKEEQEALATAETERLAQEQADADAKAKQEEEEGKALAEAEKSKQQQEAPKKWDEGLSDQAKFVLDKLAKGEDKEVYELLSNKFGHEKLSAEEKAIAFLAEKNPYLEREDLLFMAASKYGIGAEEEDESLLTDEQKKELKNQSIERKGLLNQAEQHFKDKAININIPTLPNPLDEDEGYKEYKTYKEQQQTLQEEQAKQAELDAQFERETSERVNKTALEIDALALDVKFELDKSEFALNSEFKLDDAKKKQLTDYALEYTPTQAEFKAHQNQNGELDMKGYMTALAEKLFAPQIRQALIKQAIAKDREEFTERELKNSTLRNNENMQHADVEVPFEISAMRG